MNDPTVLSASIVVLIFSVIVHEVMHGYVALMFGDHTAERAGRLTLNPIPHIDLVGSIILPAMMILFSPGFLIGWAKPVPVNPLNFTDLKRGELFVSLAGVLSNFFLAMVFAILYHINLAFFGGNPVLTQIFVKGAVINLGLGVFNLLPIPPLDGSKVLITFLPYEAARTFERISFQYGIFILIILLASGLLNGIFGFIIPLLMSLLGFAIR